MIVADTDVLIDYLRGSAPVADRIALELSRGLTTTAVSAFELWAGSRGTAVSERAVETLLAALKVVPLDAVSARTAARIRGECQSEGRMLPMADALIAGICVELDAILLTRNRKHFEGIPRLALGTIEEAQG